MKNIWIGSLLLLILLPLWGKNKAEQLRVIHSDKLYLNKVQDEQILELYGNVHFWYGETEFHSNRAMIFDKQKIARLDGNVKVNNDSLALKADSLTYYRIPDLLNAGGKVYITETRKSGSFRWFRSDFAIYDKKVDNVTVWQNVSSYDKDEKASATCGYAFWDRKNGYAYMVENPVVSSAAEDTLMVKAEKIEFFDEERKLVATFNVLAQTRDYKATSDFLLYFLNGDKAVFTGAPRFDSDYASAEAKEFYLYFEQRKLVGAELVDSCRVWFSEEPNAPKSNWVNAEYINLGFKDQAIRDFKAENSVNYYYLQSPNEKRDFFINSASGSYLEARFGDDNKLQDMKMRQGIKGIYKFQDKS